MGNRPCGRRTLYTNDASVDVEGHVFRGPFEASYKSWPAGRSDIDTAALAAADALPASALLGEVREVVAAAVEAAL